MVNQPVSQCFSKLNTYLDQFFAAITMVINLITNMMVPEPKKVNQPVFQCFSRLNMYLDQFFSAIAVVMKSITNMMVPESIKANKTVFLFFLLIECEFGFVFCCEHGSDKSNY